ncbi:MAG: M28 family peptidase [Gemmatimonadaceae bacterium]
MLPRHLVLAALALGACRAPIADPALLSDAPGTAAALRADIAWLADDAREGRGTGTAGHDSAAAFVARRHAALGIAAAPGLGGYLQPFVARTVPTRGAAPIALATQNVVALIPGRDPALAGEYVVLGAHLDHLGRGTVGALDPEAGAAIRNGADDNASGSVAILELARRFRLAPGRRSILIVHFSGEELGLLGSQYFVDNSPVPLASIQAMLNFDMVGRLKNDRLIVYGVGTAAELPALVDSVSAGSGLVVNKVPDGIGPSDHASFHTKDVPVLHFFTDIHEDYHRATDDVGRINADGLWRVVNVAEQAARALADRPGKLQVQRTVASVGAPAASRQSSGVYLGSIPDMGAADVVGMRLTGVRADSPADKAGLRAGDIVIEFGGKPVRDIYEYTDALNSFKPDDVVTVVVLRDGQRVTLQVTLGRRGN